MYQNVPFQRRLCSKFLPTIVGAIIGIDSRMYSRVLCKACFTGKLCITMKTLVGFLTSMHPYMVFKSVQHCKCLVTLSAFKWLVPCVNSLMYVSLWCISKSHVTIGTFQRLLCIGILLVPFTCCSAMKFLTAVRAWVISCTCITFLTALTVCFIWCCKTFATLRTFYGLQAWVGVFLNFKLMRCHETHFVLGTLEWPFNSMYPHMLCKFGRLSIAPAALWTAIHFLRNWLTHFHSVQVNIYTKIMLTQHLKRSKISNITFKGPK